jgi:hypothetical protein
LLHSYNFPNITWANTPETRVQFKDEHISSYHIQWKWELPGVETALQISEGTSLILYGVPARIYKSVTREYLNGDDQGEFLVSDVLLPGKNNEWVLVPAKTLYRCLSPSERICTMTTGIENADLFMTCNPQTGECFDFRGAFVLFSEQNCQNYCFIQTYKCSDDGTYKCIPVQGSSSDMNFDECTLTCNPETVMNNTKNKTGQQDRKNIMTNKDANKTRNNVNFYIVIIILSTLVFLLGLVYLKKIIIKH